MTATVTATGALIDYTEVIPTIGMTGVLSLNEPYATLVQPDVEYTCTGVRSISSMLARGEEVMQSVYILQGDAEASYKEDLRNNRSVITFHSVYGTIDLPSRALKGLPISDGVRYKQYTLNADLGLLPANLNFGGFVEDLNDWIQSKLGIVPTTQLVSSSLTTLRSAADHVISENARQAAITSNISAEARAQQLNAVVTAQAAKLAVLENYIKLNLPPP